MATTLIRNGLLYDGLGGAPLSGDVLIENDKIVAVGEIKNAQADTVIDAAGRIVCPGFVDMHRHCDVKPLVGNTFGIVELAQGITTTVSGNCGISFAPANPEKAAEMYSFNEPVLGPVGNLSLYTYRDYMDALDKAHLPLNFASMIGTGSAKIAVKGFSDTPYTPQELKATHDLIEDALQAGAVGASVGIMYLPECYSTTDEFAQILEPVGRYGAVVTAHIRGEGDSMVDSVAEMIEIGKKAKCAVEISHFKSCGMKNWQKEIHRAIALIDAARASGQDVTCDFYPYEGGSTSLTTMLPPVFVAGDMHKALAKLGTPQGVEEFRQTSSVLYSDWDNFAITLGWERILISGVNRPENRKFLSKSVTAAAQEFGFADDAACAAYLMHSEDGKVAIINMSMCQEDIDTVAKLPYANVISDAIYADTDTPHPRMFGAFPKVLREYVAERGVYTMQEAICRMTSMPAARMKLQGRGTLQVGSYADINVFDPAEFRDNATFANPAQLATGLAYCFVNGQLAVENGVLLRRNCGKNLRAQR